MERTLNQQNIDAVIHEYEASISTIGESISNLRGVALFQYLKRNQTNSGPYPHVTLFEAANRIMTDLVILKGIKWLLDNKIFPFDEYVVEYGNEDNNEHDISAKNGPARLIGEAFNVAPSFFQGKKNAMRKKLRGNQNSSNYMVIIANSDAVKDKYEPKLKKNEYYVFVDIVSGEGKLLPNKAI